MALIKCKECGKEVSDKAAACIGCGAPIVGAAETPMPVPERASGVTRQNQPTATRNQWVIIGIIVAVALAVTIIAVPKFATYVRDRPAHVDDSPQAQQERSRRGIQYCEARYKEMNADRKYEPDMLRFHAATCEKMRADYRAKYGRKP